MFAVAYCALIHLGYRHKHAQPAHSSQVKKLLWHGVISSLDERPDVRISDRNHAVKGSVDTLEALHLLQPGKVCLLRCQSRLPGG